MDRPNGETEAPERMALEGEAVREETQNPKDGHVEGWTHHVQRGLSPGNVASGHDCTGALDEHQSKPPGPRL